MNQSASTPKGDFVSSNSPAETNMKIHFALKKICAVCEKLSQMETKY